jgi:hypothetical protein
LARSPAFFASTSPTKWRRRSGGRPIADPRMSPGRSPGTTISRAL